jgi:hypothetical protein
MLIQSVGKTGYFRIKPAVTFVYYSTLKALGQMEQSFSTTRLLCHVSTT